jgi:hypothetical protein
MFLSSKVMGGFSYKPSYFDLLRIPSRWKVVLLRQKSPMSAAAKATVPFAG